MTRTACSREEEVATSLACAIDTTGRHAYHGQAVGVGRLSGQLGVTPSQTASSSQGLAGALQQKKEEGGQVSTDTTPPVRSSITAATNGWHLMLHSTTLSCHSTCRQHATVQHETLHCLHSIGYDSCVASCWQMMGSPARGTLGKKSAPCTAAPPSTGDGLHTPAHRTGDTDPCCSLLC